VSSTTYSSATNAVSALKKRHLHDSLAKRFATWMVKTGKGSLLLPVVLLFVVFVKAAVGLGGHSGTFIIIIIILSPSQELDPDT
jgi:hypothetical protein